MTTRTSKSQVGLVHGFRSGFESRIEAQLKAAGIDPTYEAIKLPYVQPAVARKYTPDFPVHPRIMLETKGRFLLEDRKKHLLLKAQHPEIDIRFIFERSKSPISKGSPTTYADWCNKHGFKYADKGVPEAWIQEILESKS